MENATEKSFKSGFVTLIGRPNVGKSTLMNHLIGQKIAITSEKPQTTRNQIRTIYTDERGQIVFLDTPGMHRARNRLGDYMVGVVKNTLKEADLILWLVEPSSYIGEKEELVLEELQKVKIPVLLIINKCDTAAPAAVEKCREAFFARYDFADVLAVSALKGEKINELLQLIFDHLHEGPQYYDEELVTEIPMRDIAAELIREKALRNLSAEIPHGIAVSVERFSERDDGSFDIDASIICEKESHKGIIIGKGGAMLKKIGTEARREIEGQMEAKCNLKLWVKIRKEWRNNELQLRNFGYRN